MVICIHPCVHVCGYVWSSKLHLVLKKGKTVSVKLQVSFSGIFWGSNLGKHYGCSMSGTGMKVGRKMGCILFVVLVFTMIL